MKLRALYFLLAILFSSYVGAAETDRQFKYINAASDLADNSAQIIVCTRTGRMIISTLGNMNFFDGASFVHIDSRPEYQYLLPAYHGHYHLYFDRRHHIWLKNKGAVTCVDMMLEHFVENVDSVVRGMGCNEPLNDLFVDSLGSVWMVTPKGLFSVDEQKYHRVYSKRNMQDLDVFGKTLLTFFDNGEVVGQSLETGRLMFRKKAYGDEIASKYEKTSVLLRYENGYYQIRNGEKGSILLHFDLKNRIWTTLLELPYSLNNFALKDDILYLPSEYGYWIYDIATKKFEHVSAVTLMDGSYLSTDCNTLAFDLQGGMWIGTERRGLLYSGPMASPFHIYPWGHPKATEYSKFLHDISQERTEYRGMVSNCLFRDSRGWRWVGTTRGLYLYRTDDRKPVFYNKQNGLPNNVVHAVVEDENHNIWLSTSAGISCILIDNNEPVFVNSFTALDNIPIETFKNNRAISLQDGTIVMEGLDHVVAFHPDSFGVVNDRKPNMLYPKMVKLQVNGHVVNPGDEVGGNIIVDQAITRARDISLNSDQNSISLTFSALNYFRPLQTYYRVRVIGMANDEEWQMFSYNDEHQQVDSKGMLHLALLGLLPGDYTIEVQASMFPDQWDGEPFQWQIHVNQPWWQTQGVQILLGVVVIALIIFNFVIYNKNTRLRVRRSNAEGEMIRKICSFVERCDSFSSEVLMPTQEDLSGNIQNESTKLSPEFITVMLKVIPYVRQQDMRSLTMLKLSQVSDVSVVKLYELMSSELYKSPRELVRIFRLQRAADLLRTTNFPVENIAKECGFYTPNYFLGNFFHEYKMTPKEYRAKKI